MEDSYKSFDLSCHLNSSSGVVVGNTVGTSVGCSLVEDMRGKTHGD